MNRIQLFSVLCEPNQSTAFKHYLSANPRIRTCATHEQANAFNSDPDIKKYWQSPLGRFNRDFVRLMTTIELWWRFR